MVAFLFPISSWIHWIIINSQSMTQFAITEEFFFWHQDTNLSSGENALSPFTWESCQIPALVDTRFNQVYNNVITYMLYSILWVSKEKARINYYTLIRMAIIKWSANNKCWRGCREKGTVSGNVNWCTHYGKQCSGFFKKLKLELSYDLIQQSHLWAYIQRKFWFEKVRAPPCS